MTVRRATRLSTITSLDRTGPIAYSSATNSVYLILPADTGQAVVRVDLASFSVANSQYVNFTPTGMAVTPDGTEVLVTGSLGGTQILDGTTLAPKGSIAGGLQQSIVLAPQ
jgi:DNA-binding beta-propeller fold protein YncE